MTTTEEKSGLAPGQFYGKKWIIYSALSEPVIRREEWHLKTKGLVEKELDLTFSDLEKMPQAKFTRSFQCLPPNSLVYANPEPKQIKDLAVGDMVIGRDGKRHKIDKVIRNHYEGNLVGLKASYLPPARMTSDHPVLAIRSLSGLKEWKGHRRERTFSKDIKPDWIRADKLNIGDYVFFPKYREISDEYSIKYGENSFNLDECFAYVLGWYVAEGSGGDSEGRRIRFALNANELESVEKLQRMLRDLFGAKTSVYYNERKTGVILTVTSCKIRFLLRALKDWCGEKASTKKIPDFILNAKPNVLKAFLLGLFEGDGWSPVKNGRLSRYNDLIDITTCSITLAYQLILAMSKLDIPAQLVNHQGSVRAGYSIRIRGGDKVRKLIPDFPLIEKINKFHYWETADGFYYPIRKIWSEQYSGEVYDFQAPGFTMLSPFATQDCVTKWSIKDVIWDGVAFREIAKLTGVKPEAKWVMFRCADGYTAPVPLEDAMVEDSIIAFQMNGRPIPWQQGFPARPFIPHLYGWKSAKWLNEIEFMPEYRDGYWEMYGYNERGDIWDEERFKGHQGKHSKRRSLGTAEI